MGYQACLSATSDASPLGLVGVGSGATCGKVLGSDNAMRGGVGTASAKLANGVVIGALAVCNAWGDVCNPRLGRIVAGARDPADPERFLDTETYICQQSDIDTRYFGMDTTLCVVATNARFSREQATKLAMMAQDGIARAIRPSHTMFDGDVVFALSLASGEERQLDVNIAGSYAARLVEEAIVHGVCTGNNIPFEGYTAESQPYEST
jgi:L-aminopeptidase/D-esterase-like protein